MNLPLGRALDWTPARRPAPTELRGFYALLRSVSPDDAEPLYPLAYAPTGDPSIWTYLPDGPFESPEQLRRGLESAQSSEDPLWFTLVRLPDERPLGLAAYQRIKPEHGVIEIGRIWYGPPLKRTTAASELIYLLARHAFDDLGYRRLEWKCDALRRVAARRRALRIRVRRRLPPAHGGQGTQPRHRLVLDCRRRLAGDPRRLRGLAGAGELRRPGPAAALAARADRALVLIEPAVLPGRDRRFGARARRQRGRR